MKENKKYVINTKILPFFEDLPINQIDSLKIRKWQNWLLKQETSQGKKLSQTYIKTINNQISAILNYAVKFYNLPSNPIHKTGSIGKKHADTMQFWTLDEFNQFIEAVSDKPTSKIIFNLLFWTGIRSGELLALNGKDFDKVNLTLNVNKSYARLNRRDIISEPKTPKSKRVISLSESLFEDLDEYINKIYDYDPEARLFPVDKFYLQNEMKRGSKNADVKKIRTHDLRHSHASLLVEMGCSPILIQERLGHEEIETTLRTYSHLYPNKQQDMAKQMNDLKIKSKVSPAQ
ncbi:tyrosine-type recombinase/integrase [Carnobacterium sp.]|uniref:tyrosine-type recombinase/integrase n=1 Tax=Carnobacterium sp. TaxID=48221 RepID=UPI003C75CD30